MASQSGSVFRSASTATATATAQLQPFPLSGPTQTQPRPVARLPATQSYAGLCKVVLARRLKHMMGLTAFAAYCALFALVFDPRRFLGSLLSVFGVLLRSPLAMAGAIPILVLHKLSLTTDPPTTPSLFGQLALLGQPAAPQIFFAHLAGAGPLLLSYILCANYVSKDSRLSPLYFHQGRDAQQLNERFIFLVVQHLCLTLAATIHFVVRHRSRVVFDRDSSLSIPTRLHSALTSRIPRLLRAAAYFNAGFYVSYILLRRTIIRVLVMNFAGDWARPYLYSLVKHNAAYSVSLPLRALSSTFLTLSVWEVAHVCFEVYATQPMSVSHFAPKPNQCLRSGLASPDPYYQHFAFLELASLSVNDAARRKSIFTDIKTENGSGGAWNDLSRECLKLIGTELQRAKGRGVLPPAPSDSPATATAPSTPSHASPVENGNVFRPGKKTFFTSLLTPPPATAASPAAPTGVSSAVAPAASSATVRVVPSVFQTSTPAPAAPSAPAPVTSKPEVVQPFEVRILAMLPVEWQSAAVTALLGRQPSQVVGICVVESQCAIWAVQALASLLCASLQDDPYGVAQRDIPRILEAFVRYLTALENLSVALEMGASELERPGVVREVARQVGPVKAALERAVQDVLGEFRPYLDSFTFPPPIAARLDALLPPIERR